MDVSLLERVFRILGVNFITLALLFTSMLTMYALYGHSSPSDAKIRGVDHPNRGDEVESDLPFGSQPVNWPTGTATILILILSLILKWTLNLVQRLFQRPQSFTDSDRGA